MARGKQKGGAGPAPPPPGFAPDEGGLTAVADAIDAAEDEDLSPPIGADDPRPGLALDGVQPGEWTPDEFGLPENFPVLPLGTEDGVFYFLDTIGQLRALKDSELGQATIRGLFMGRHWYLHWAFPRKNADGVVTSWRPERAAEVLTAACARRGSWSPANNVRGRGFWRDRQGRLVVHAGNRLLTHRGPEPLGEHEGRVYPTRPPLPAPWPTSLTGKRGPAAILLAKDGLLRSWRWVRPDLDPILLIGAVAVGYLGGALTHRPATYVLGDKATGKSALHNDLKALQGEWMVNTGDTTSAGLYQLLKFDALAIAIDEFEAKADNRKAKAVVELMRLSYTGAPMHRGGDNHKGTQFHGRSAFTFSSINMPAMEPQDLSRMVVLRLQRQPPGAVKPIVPEEQLAELGRKLMRRLIDNWHRWHATLAAWKEFLASCGHDGRGQDTFGTLMAAADLAIAEDAIELELDLGENAENFNAWREALAAERLSEMQDAAFNWQLCLTHLLSKRIEAWRGGTRHTVGQVLAEYLDTRGSGMIDALGYDDARKLLEQTGLTLLKPPQIGGAFSLLIPFNHPLLYEVFRDSKWAGELGSGSWANALKQATNAEGRLLWSDRSGRINGVKFKGIAFELKDIIVSEKEASG